MLTFDLGGTASFGPLARGFRDFGDAETKARLSVAEFAVAQASMEKVFLRIVAGGASVLAQAEEGRAVAAALQEEDEDDELERELASFKFKEATCCGCARRASADARWS